MRRRLPALVVAAALMLVPAPGSAVLVATVVAGPAGASTEAPTPTTLALTRGDELGNSLPGPNTGTPPRHSGDPGGAAQTALFFVLLAAIAFIAVMVWREVRRQRRRTLADTAQPAE